MIESNTILQSDCPNNECSLKLVIMVFKKSYLRKREVLAMIEFFF